MKLGQGAAHLTYCTNIHPGESWAEIRANLERHVLAVKRAVCPDRPFGVGLRLGFAATQELSSPSEIQRLREFLDRNGLYVFTINAFPYGTFHATSVKEQVYRPDWLEEERLAYSDAVATILSQLIPRERTGDEPALMGSISTVPGCFRARAREGARERIGAQLARHAATLWHKAEQGGACLVIALEPEPECLLETTTDATRFLERYVFSGAGAATFADATGLAGAKTEAALRRHVGICLDACHAAVEFEDPASAVAVPRSAGVGIFKLQVSAGLRVPGCDRAKRKALEPFAEGVYLHQVVIERSGELERVQDLPLALARAEAEAQASAAEEEWRIHFHVPIFRDSLGPFASTQGFLAELLALQAERPFTQHLEVETYTWDVLPEEFRGEPVAQAVARELRWSLEKLGERRP